ncbi:hypothetical protein GCG21_08700 [Pseudactinotalea sp. HY160]|uniref:DNA methyltransferase n=1 Tax=Pseudactinotalea sp. HY160 TaxID=2654490 RepID=UPI00128AF432|nr:DNA methyltransferase [Pseudactinotalea sp. HY160]MPV50083.1 hypothetical protein [Pseudactinotalea sp. HY160]
MPIHFDVPAPAAVPLTYTTRRRPRPGDTITENTGINNSAGTENGTGQPHEVVSVTGGAVATTSGLIIPIGSVTVVAPAGEMVPADIKMRPNTGITGPAVSGTGTSDTGTATEGLAGAQPLGIRAGRPEHLLIEGDTAHACPLLGASGHVFDLAYLDPPYDTGHDLSYADDREDWADFFHTRLVRATRLLDPDRGVVIIAIDDRRMAWARLITDAVLGADSFVACVVWDGGVKGQARLVSTSHDYMLIYAVNPAWMRRNKVQWREPKPGADLVTATARRLWDGDPVSSQEKMTAWFKSLSASNPAKSLYLYRCFNSAGRLFREGPVSKPSGRGYVYDVPHPVTGLPVVPPSTGWRYAPDRMERMLAEDRIVFRADHTRSVATKLYLDEQGEQVATSVFTEKRTRAAKRLAAQLDTIPTDASPSNAGGSSTDGSSTRQAVAARFFTYPKDTGVLARWLALATQNRADASFLDVFAGSGSLTQAVMEMNAADSGHRTSVAITLNEVPAGQARDLMTAGHRPGDAHWEAAGLIEQVTRPRLEMVAAELDQHLKVGRVVIGAGRYVLDEVGTAVSGAEAAA